MFLKVSNRLNREDIHENHFFSSFFIGANFPTTPDAMKYFKDNGVILGPAIAANAGSFGFI